MAVAEQEPRTLASSGTTTIVKIATATGNLAAKGMFGAWCQHIVSVPGQGIFQVYKPTCNSSPYATADAYGPFHLMRSTDSGDTWTRVYDSSDDGIQGHHQSIDCDENGNVYVFMMYEPSASTWNNYIWTFPVGNYGNPTRVHNSWGSSKYSFLYDPYRKKLCVLMWTGATGGSDFRVLNLDGTQARAVTIKKDGPQPPLIHDQYSCLGLGPDGLLIAGCTTTDQDLQNRGTQNYYNATMVTSKDGGQTWFGKNGQVTLPMIADERGPAHVLTNPNDATEFRTAFPAGNGYPGNWNMINDFAFNNGYINCNYSGGIPSPHHSTVQFNYASSTMASRHRINTSGVPLGGAAGEASCTFSQNPGYAGRLYQSGQVSSGGLRIGTVYSDDSGATWHDYSVSSTSITPVSPAYLGTARILDENGFAIGTFANTIDGNTADIYFFRTTADYTGSAPAQPVAVSFPATGVLDDFTYTADPLSSHGNWTDQSATVGNLKANGTQALSAAADGTYGGALWTATKHKAPVECFVDVAVMPANPAHRINLYWGNQAAASNDAAFYGYRPSYSAANGGQVFIDRVEAGASTNLLTQTVGALAAGDALGMNVDGTSLISVYWRKSGTWSLIASFQDSAPLPELAPAPPLQYIGVATNDATARLDNFGGGSPKFPTTPVLDTFDYTRDPLGGNWVKLTSGSWGDFKANGSVAMPQSVVGLNTGSATSWNGSTWSDAPIEVYCDVTTLPYAEPNWIGLYWNSTNSVDTNHSHYRAAYFTSSGVPTVDVHYTLNGGSGNVVGTQAGVPPLQPGDGFGMKITLGGMIIVYFRQLGVWSAVASFQDSTPLWNRGINQPLRYIGIGATDIAVAVDNFGGGVASTLSAATISPPSLISDPPA